MRKLHVIRAGVCLLVGFFVLSAPLRAWDSDHWNPTRPTHSMLTRWAIEKIGNSELSMYGTAVVDGANTELHELKSSNSDRKTGKKYGVDVEAKRIAHGGTNEGCTDIAGWWKDALQAYREGKKERAYFYLGILLHMVQDLGVPAHANRVYHQGNMTEFDNFEFMALKNWKPDYSKWDVDKTDPGYADPSQYYAFSDAWTKADAPGYHDRSSFSKTWLFAKKAEKLLLSRRQARTCHLTMWTLRSALKVFGNGGQWAKGRLLAGPVTLQARDATAKNVVVLEAGKHYFVVGGGTCSLWDGQQDGCDSVYRYRTPLESGGGQKVIWGQLELFDPNMHLSDAMERQLGSKPTYNPAHVYEAVIEGTGKMLRARVYDGGGYGDNHGALTVTVYEAVQK